MQLFLAHIVTGDTNQLLLDLVRYVAFCISEGDYANDWITHLPLALRPAIITIGQALATVFGA